MVVTVTAGDETGYPAGEEVTTGAREVDGVSTELLGAYEKPGLPVEMLEAT